MALFDKIRSKNTVLEPKVVPKYSAKVSDEDLEIMRHEVFVPEGPKTKEELELELVQSIIASPIEKLKEKQEVKNPVSTPKVEIKKEENAKLKTKELPKNNVEKVSAPLKEEKAKKPQVNVTNVGSNVMVIGALPKKEDNSIINKEEEAKRNVMVIDSQVVKPGSNDSTIVEEKIIPHNVIIIEDKHDIVYI